MPQKAEKTTLEEKKLKFDERFKSSLKAEFDLRVIPETLDEPSRTVQMTATTNWPYLKGWYYEYEEMLEISEEAIDLGRLKMGKMPLLKDHNNSVDAVIGRVLHYKIARSESRINEFSPASDFAENRDELIVTVYIDDDEDSDKVFQKLKKGLLGNVSIGYKVKGYDLHEFNDINTPDRVIVRDWELLEVSVVAVPADPFAGARSVDKDTKKIQDSIKGQSNEEQGGGSEMTEEQKKAAEEVKRKAEQEAATKKAVEEAKKEEAERQRERASTIGQICQETGLDFKEMIESKKTIDEVRSLGYKKLLEKNTKVKTTPVSVGTEDFEKKNKAFQEYFIGKAKQKSGKANVDKSNLFLGMPLVDAMAKFCEEPWVDRKKFLREHMSGQRTLGQGSFPALIEDAMNRVLNDAYNERTNVFDEITVTEVQNNLHDHKPRRFDIDGIPDEVKESEDIPIVGAVGESNAIEILKYGKAFELTEEAMLNDDLRGFDRIFMYFGRGMGLREANLIAKVLFDTSVTFAGAALYSTDRLNLVTAAGGINLANVKGLRQAMRQQQTPAGKPLDIFPSCIICGEDQAEDANSFLQSTVYPRQYGDDPVTVRRGITKVITHPYIDQFLGNKSDKDFLLAASPMDGGVEIVKRIVHRDAQVPEVYSQWNKGRTSMIYFNKFYLGIGLADYRGLVKHSGT